MADKDQKSLTINDIIEQLSRPTVLKSQNTPGGSRISIPQNAPEQTSIASNASKDPNISSGGLHLPSLAGRNGRNNSEQDSLKSNDHAKSSIFGPVKLSVRTMADDLKGLRSGQKPEILTVDRMIKAENIGEKSSQKIGAESIPQEIQSKHMIKQQESILPDLGANNSSLYPNKRPMSNQTNQSSSPIAPRSVRNQLPPNKDTSYFSTKPTTVPTMPSEEKVEYGVIAKVVSSGMTTGILSTILVAIAVYFLLSFFIFNEETTEIVTNSPTVTAVFSSTTPKPEEIDVIFGTVGTSTFVISEDADNILQLFNAFVDAENLSSGEFKKINFIAQNSPSQKISFPNLMKYFTVSYPAQLSNLVKGGNVEFIYGQNETFGVQDQEEIGIYNNKRLVFIIEVSDINGVSEVLKAWEPNMPNDLKEIFSINPTEEASDGFIDNAYRGVKIRYKNFPFPDKSIDYAIVTSLTGRNYLVISNSRESMFTPIDRIQGVK